MSQRRASSPNVFARLWSRAFAAGRRRAVLAPRSRVRPRLEYLEDRLVPATFDVTTLAATGAGSLSAAFSAANTSTDLSNTIDITVAGTYHIGTVGPLTVFANATTGQSGLSLDVENVSGGTVTINGDNMTRILDINPNDINGGATPNGTILGAVTIGGITLTRGLASSANTPDGAAASGGAIRDQGPVDLTLNNDIIANSSATADGGGISMEQPPVNNVSTSTKWKLNLNNTTVINNHAGDAGGGVEEDGTGIVNITNSTIADNTCLNQGAGVWLDAINGGTATLTVTGSIVDGNTAGMLGGGIGNAGTSTVTINNSTIEHNFTPGDGGGFANQATLGTSALGTLNVTNSLFLDNSASTNGGGIEEGGVLSIVNSEIKGNAAGINGAMPIGSAGGVPNTVQGSGGGLFVDGGTLTLTSSTVADNTATINGGGIELQTTAASTITNSTIANNTALNSGGIGNGGGIDAGATFTNAVTLLNNTITNNFAVNGGGVFYAGTGGSTFSVQNTIIAQNTVTGTGPDADNPAGTFTDLGGNLIGISGAGSGNSGFTAGTDKTGTVGSPLNPMVTGLTNNGGPLVGATGAQMTLETEALLPGSPAIGLGVATGAPTTDERGFGRGTSIDAGAFQFANAALSVAIGTQPTLNLGASETVSVTVTNNSGNALPADGSTVTVTTTSGLGVGSPMTFTLGALAAGQSQVFSFTATGTVLGSQTIVATVTSPDTNPATVSTSAMVTVTPKSVSPPPPPTAPVGTLSFFAFGFGPTGLDLFDVDSAGNVWAMAFFSPGALTLINTTLQMPLAVFQNNQILALLTASTGQNFLIDVLNPFAPGVLSVLLAALHL